MPKIEEEIRGPLAVAKEQWLAKPETEQASFWPELRRPKAEQRSLFDLSGITDAQFWNTAERAGLPDGEAADPEKDSVRPIREGACLPPPEIWIALIVKWIETLNQ